MTTISVAPAALAPRSDPAVRVGVEEDAPSRLGAVVAARVPQAAVEDDGGSGADEERDGVVRLAVAREHVARVAARDEAERAMVGRGHVGEEPGDLERESRPRRIELGVLA